MACVTETLQIPYRQVWEPRGDYRYISVVPPIMLTNMQSPRDRKLRSVLVLAPVEVMIAG
jgi:hypothetical protein